VLVMTDAKEALGLLETLGVEGPEQGKLRHTLWRLGREAALVLWAAQAHEALDSGTEPVEELSDLQ